MLSTLAFISVALAHREVTCTLSDGLTTVPIGWGGDDVGPNSCNMCRCLGQDILVCSKRACAPECTLSDGQTKVAVGWGGKDVGDNSCNTCSCTGPDMLRCTLMACFPETGSGPGCTLNDGITDVPVGWSGNDVGDNHCNTCTCEGANYLSCTEMWCMPEVEIEVEGEGCTLHDGTTQVPVGWSGNDVGENHCNTCTCEGANYLTCTEMWCMPEVEIEVEGEGCTLNDGTTKVPVGWSGNDLGDNDCNTCTCEGDGYLMCTEMGCRPEVDCTLSDGMTTVPFGWSGKDVGSNSCNTCNCVAGGLLGCTKMLCPRRQGCTLSDLSEVPVGWRGNDTGENSCNTCRCVADDTLACSKKNCNKSGCVSKNKNRTCKKTTLCLWNKKKRTCKETTCDRMKKKKTCKKVKGCSWNKVEKACESD